MLCYEYSEFVFKVCFLTIHLEVLASTLNMAHITNHVITKIYDMFCGVKMGFVETSLSRNVSIEENCCFSCPRISLVTND